MQARLDAMMSEMRSEKVAELSSLVMAYFGEARQLRASLEAHKDETKAQAQAITNAHEQVSAPAVLVVMV